MFHIYFLGSSEGLLFDVANANFDVALWDPLRTYLTSRGVRICTGVSVTAISHERRFAVACDDGTGIEADGVVLATDVNGLRSIVHNSPDLGDDDWRRRIDGLQTAPPFVVQRLWLDRRVNRDRAAFMGTGGRPPLDNVSVLDRYERQAADWSAEVGGSVVELHAYALTAPDDGLCDHLLGRLRELYPETAGANIIGERVLRRNDCPRFAPGDFDRRPTVDTPEKA